MKWKTMSIGILLIVTVVVINPYGTAFAQSDITPDESAAAAKEKADEAAINAKVAAASPSAADQAAATDIINSGVISSDVQSPSTTDVSPTADASSNTDTHSILDLQSSPSSNSGPDFTQICNTLQIALYHSCSELVDPDGSLTPIGQDTVKCTLTGAIGGLGGISIFHLAPGMVINGLNFLAGKTGCAGLVKLDMLNSIGDINGILNQLTRFVH